MTSIVATTSAMPPRPPRGGRGLPAPRGGRAVPAPRGRGRGQGRGNAVAAVVPPLPAAAPAPTLAMMDEDQVLKVGLELVGFPEFRQRISLDERLRRFRAFFGVSPKALSCLYADLETIMPKIDPFNFFMSISWLKLYDTEHVLAGRWGLDEETIRLKVKGYVTKIQELKAMKVTWGDFEFDETFIISVDGIHCRIQEVRKDPGAKWYSHKSNSAGVTYELGIAIRSNRLVWINGPFPASQHDITTFRSRNDPQNGLMAKIPPGKRAIGDSGYKGEATKIAITHGGDSAEVKKFKARAKSRHETFNARLKSFGVLERSFRHGFDQHQRAFESVCICVQYDIENGHGLFEV